MLIFIALLGAYVVASEWAGLDSRLPFGMAAVVLVAAMVTYAAGNRGASDAITGYIFLLIAAGILLFLIDQLRAALKARLMRQKPNRELQTG